MLRPMTTRPSNSHKQQLGVVGIGFDNDDGHKRVTEGRDFTLVGGSAETHEKMTELVIKMKEGAKRRGKNLRELSREEFEALAYESFE
jgi:hypothetical protein